MQTIAKLKIRAMRFYPDSPHLQKAWLQAQKSVCALPITNFPKISYMYDVAVQETPRSWQEVENKWEGMMRK